MILLLVLVCFGTSGPVFAKTAAQITDCSLSSASTVKVTAQLDLAEPVEESVCYLFALPLSSSKIGKADRPIQSRAKAQQMIFSVALNQKKTSSRLYSKFVVAVKKEDGRYEAISNLTYISNPQKAAKYTYQFPTASSKKGLQVAASMVEDAVELRVQHSVVNINLAEVIAFRSEENSASSYSYKYHGKTYWFRRGVVAGYDSQLQSLKANNAVISAILLLSCNGYCRRL